MVQAVNQLIRNILKEEYDKSIGTRWFTKDRLILLELLIKNFERIRSRPDLSQLKIKDLLAYLYPLILRYKKSISYRDFLKLHRQNEGELIKDQVDLAITNLKNLLRYVYVSEIIETLRARGISGRLITEAMTLPDLQNAGINKIKKSIRDGISVCQDNHLTKETIFLLSVLRIAAHHHAEKLEIPEIEDCLHFYEVKHGASNYNDVKRIALIVKASVIRLNELYPSHKKLFLARDGLVLYEAQLTLFKDNSDVIYVSRSTLGKFFDSLNKELTNAIEEEGIGNVKKIIINLEQKLRILSENEKIALIFNSLIRYLTPYVNSKTVFVDSSSRSLPVILAALCRIYFPEQDFKVFFSTTFYNDPTAVRIKFFQA